MMSVDYFYISMRRKWIYFPDVEFLTTHWVQAIIFDREYQPGNPLFSSMRIER